MRTLAPLGRVPPRRQLHLAALGISMLLAGCGGLHQKVAYSGEELRDLVRERAPDVPAELVVIPFAVPAEDVELARRVISDYDAPGDKVQALVQALFDPGVFGLSYVPTVTTTATETLRGYSGNCLALASVFVGLARALGFRAYFLDASSRVSETTREDPGLVVNAGHITAAVDAERSRWYLDFDRSLRYLRHFRVIDDVEVLAHFYNNRGYERVEVARVSGMTVDWDEAASDFRMATRVEPRFALAWNNLGIAHARLGQRPEAEAAYRRAIALTPSAAAPYNNLGALFLASSRPAQAVTLLRQAVQLEPDGAHTHYNLGRALLMLGEQAAGVRALERAAELRDREAKRLLTKIEHYDEARARAREGSPLVPLEE